MQVKKAVGRNASTLRYDILSALGVTALASDKHHQRLVLRLIVLITTRYNWQSNELSMGRAEMARLWGVDERTVKRELAKLRTLGWLGVKRAGVKGRVTLYQLELDAIMATTQPVWEVIGPDFVARMDLSHPQPAAPAPNVIPFQQVTRDTGMQDGAWGRALRALRAEDAALANAWFAQLEPVDLSAGSATLRAPSRFVADYIRTHLSRRLLAALSAADPDLRKLVLISGPQDG